MPGYIPNDSIVSLLLFLLGVPVLVYQIVPEEIRGLVIPPGSSSLKFFAPAAVGLVATVLAYAAPQELQSRFPWLWGFLLLLLLLCAGWTSIMIILTMNKKRLIDKLAGGLIQDLCEGGEYPDSGLEKLELIGKESKGGEEREWSIRALDGLADHVLDSPAYSGGQLDELITALDHVLLESNKPSTPENFRSAFSVMQKINHRYWEGNNDPEFVDSDVEHAWRCLGVWGQRALDLPGSALTDECIGILSTRDGQSNPALSEALREIGIAAVEHQGDQTQIAMHATRSIQAMASAPNVQPNDEVGYDLIALLAHIWSHGPSGEAWIREEAQGLGDGSAGRTRRAILHFRRTGHFEVADKIAAMCEALYVHDFESHATGGPMVNSDSRPAE